MNTHTNLTWSKEILIINSIVLDPVTESEIDKEIKELNANKSSGHDDIAPKVVKKISEYIVKPLTHIFNLSIVTGKIPETFKIGIVTPVYKGNDKEKLSNYRPISVLTCFSKNSWKGYKIKE